MNLQRAMVDDDGERLYFSTLGKQADSWGHTTSTRLQADSMESTIVGLVVDLGDVRTLYPWHTVRWAELTEES